MSVLYSIRPLYYIVSIVLYCIEFLNAVLVRKEQLFITSSTVTKVNKVARVKEFFLAVGRRKISAGVG